MKELSNCSEQVLNSYRTEPFYRDVWLNDPESGSAAPRRRNLIYSLICVFPDNAMNLRYYILFANYEQGLALRDLLLSDGIPNRIAPAPRAIQGDLSCGMSLLIEPEHIEDARRSIEAHHAQYHRIASLEGQIQSRRDHYC